MLFISADLSDRACRYTCLITVKSEKEGNKMQSYEEYMRNLKQWLRDTADSPVEEMSDFFTKRLQDYEEHMSFIAV